MIRPDDLCQFCQQHREVVIGNCLNLERIEFGYKYLFPSVHNYLLSVREHKKERAASVGATLPNSEEKQTDAGCEQSEFTQELKAACPKDREEPEDEL